MIRKKTNVKPFRNSIGYVDIEKCLLCESIQIWHLNKVIWNFHDIFYLEVFRQNFRRRYLRFLNDIINYKNIMLYDFLKNRSH